MAIMDSGPSGDQDVMRVWSLLMEVSEQLTQNRTLSVSLHSLASGIKSQAVHSQTGFVLRRFNLDKPKELYDAELERMNTAMSAENQTLLNDNRQLVALIREYEQTLENVMSTFRTRAHEVQERELALMRDYERAIIQRETEALKAALTAGDARSASLARSARLLRAVMRKLGGEDVQVCEELAAAGGEGAAWQPSALSYRSAEDRAEQASQDRFGAATGEGDAENDPYAPLESELTEDEDPERRLAAAEWALTREIELARLERENQELRSLLTGVVKGNNLPIAPASTRPSPNQSPNPNEELADRAASSWQPPRFRQLGGIAGTVGPYGTLKKGQPCPVG